MVKDLANITVANKVAYGLSISIIRVDLGSSKGQLGFWNGVSPNILSLLLHSFCGIEGYCVMKRPYVCQS